MMRCTNRILLLLTLAMMPALMLISGGVSAQSSQCSFISDPDRQAYCRATTGGGNSQCGFIRDPDLQAMCRAQTGGGTSQCSFIRSPDMQAACRAQAGK